MIGIFGGTFDPIHNGHLLIASQAADDFSLEKVIFVPARIPPHRDEPIATPEERGEMVELAIADEPLFEMSRIELDRPETSYTIDTVKIIAKHYPDQPLALIIGEDAYAQFTEWLHWEEILEFVELIVINRGDQDTSISDEAIDQERVHALTIPPCSISATEIRECIAQHLMITELVPTAVAEYIETNHLYQT